MDYSSASRERPYLFPVARALAGTAVLFIVAALAEEAVFRGYPLQTFTRAQLLWFGVFLTSVPFAIAHAKILAQPFFQP